MLGSIGLNRVALQLNLYSRSFPAMNAENTVETSRRTYSYNCIAWAAGDTLRQWWPDSEEVGWWPEGIPREITLAAFVQAYGTLGFTICVGDGLEAGIEKIALYGKQGDNGSTEPTHAAIQLENGEWSSKLGGMEDIRHSSPEVVVGPEYGKVVCYLSRPRPQRPHPANAGIVSS